MFDDKPQRHLAIDPTQSFIVQAPAGSGKTELLTQRFLNLLANVTEPEQIVAITFTKKAAHEMRERIINAIEKATHEAEPTQEHQLLTWKLACNVLNNNKKYKWHLLKQPHRLKVQTIDSLCHNLIKKTPLLSRNNPYATISEDCHSHYKTAAQQCIQFALKQTNLCKAASLLLRHLDNQQGRLIDLMVQMLAQREHWLTAILKTQTVDKSYFENALEIIQVKALQELQAHTPTQLKVELLELANYSASLVPTSNPLNKLDLLADEAHLNLDVAQTLAGWLLKQDHEVRKVVTKKEGFPAASHFSNADEKNQAIHNKKRMLTLLAELENHPEFIQALRHVRKIPQKAYDKNQWEIMQSMFQLLPLLAAHLGLIFNQMNQIDFNTISHQALNALGDEDTPTDLSLFMDNQIHHLLIDEFQDTSIQQFQLLEKLTAGWLPDEGKTVFIVGDPMQSIYRFRQAQVGLFLKARDFGLGNIKLTALYLSTNFRSSSTLVNWTNQTFSALFPKENKIEMGAVTYHASLAFHQEKGDAQGIEKYHFEDKLLQAEHMVKLIRQHLEECPQQTLGVLVKNRRQLSDIVVALKKASIPYQGVDIASLARDACIQDLWCLTKALLLPADRLSWLSLLHSPLCGVELHDIHRLANNQPKKSILCALKQCHQITHLSDKKRVSDLAHLFEAAIQNRQNTSLCDWIEPLWYQLGANELVAPSQKEDIEQYWRLLDQHEKHGRIINFTDFENKLNQLYSKKTTQSKVQIMTIHKSKGLEFDCVILPGLDNALSQRDTPLMQWMEVPQPTQAPLLLMSPIKAHDSECDSLYDYISHLDKHKEKLESQRLLYVAVTRAKRRLILMTSGVLSKNQNSFASMLKTQAFETPSLRIEVPDAPEVKIITYQNAGHQFKESIPPLKPNHINFIVEPDRDNRITGTFLHTLFKRAAYDIYHHNTQTDTHHWAMRLAELGAVNIDAACQKSQTIINNFIQQEKGQWLINQTSEACNELEIMEKQGTELKTFIIDRTFLINGSRWIVDYKTGRYNKNVVNNRYEKQLKHYAKLFYQLEVKEIHCDIYYPATGTSNSWKEYGLNVS